MVQKSFILTSTLLILLLSNFLFSQETDIQNPIFNSEGMTFLYHNNYANSVYLKSSFDQWNLKYPFRKKMSERGVWDGYWELKLPIKYSRFQLKKDKYTYKLVVDGEFIVDPFNPNSENDGLGNMISYFELKQDLIDYNRTINPLPVKQAVNYYRFVYKNFGVKQVYLVGNFNHWNPYSLPMTKLSDGIWEIKIKLYHGRYIYNFIVDDRWIKDPLNTRTSRNPVGKTYSLFEVKK